MKKISVIIPCYNVASYIDKCMISITSQTIGVDALEIICIDDASEDDTWRHLQKWEKMFPKDIILLRQPENRRQGTARNLGLLYASAEWIAFVDADDWLEFDYFQKLYSPVYQWQCDVVVCGIKRDIGKFDDGFLDEHNSKAGKEFYLVADTKELKAASLNCKIMGVGPVAKIIRRKLLIESGIFFPEDLTYEDHYWIPLLHLYATNIYMIEENLYHYFQNPYSTTQMKNKDHVVDCFTVQMMKWRDYSKAGLLTEYRAALEEDFLWYTIPSVAAILSCQDDVCYSYFQLEQAIIRMQMPDCRNVLERCINNFPEIQHTILRALCTDVSMREFEQFVKAFKKMYVGQ